MKASEVIDVRLEQQARRKAEKREREAIETLDELYALVSGTVIMPRSLRGRIQRLTKWLRED